MAKFPPYPGQERELYKVLQSLVMTFGVLYYANDVSVNCDHWTVIKMWVVTSVSLDFTSHYIVEEFSDWL